MTQQPLLKFILFCICLGAAIGLGACSDSAKDDPGNSGSDNEGDDDDNDDDNNDNDDNDDNDDDDTGDDDDDDDDNDDNDDNDDDTGDDDDDDNDDNDDDDTGDDDDDTGDDDDDTSETTDDDDTETETEVDKCSPEAIVGAVSMVNLKAGIKELTDLYERTSYEGQSEGLAVIKARLDSYNVSYNEHTYNYDGHTWVNLEVVIRGSDLEDEIIMAGGHYDSLPSSGPSPGADDNASGSAAMMEFARVLNGCQFRRTIKLLYFSNEERGLVGSAFYAADAAAANDNIKGFYGIDTIAWGPEDEDITVATKTSMPWLANAVKEVGDAYIERDIELDIDDQCG